MKNLKIFLWSRGPTKAVQILATIELGRRFLKTKEKNEIYRYN